MVAIADWTAVLYLSTAIVGAGVFQLPAAVQQGGMFSLLFFPFAAFIFGTTSWWLCKATSVHFEKTKPCNANTAPPMLSTQNYVLFTDDEQHVASSSTSSTSSTPPTVASPSSSIYVAPVKSDDMTASTVMTSLLHPKRKKTISNVLSSSSSSTSLASLVFDAFGSKARQFVLVIQRVALTGAIAVHLRLAWSAIVFLVNTKISPWYGCLFAAVIMFVLYVLRSTKRFRNPWVAFAGLTTVLAAMLAILLTREHRWNEHDDVRDDDDAYEGHLPLTITSVLFAMCAHAIIPEIIASMFERRHQNSADTLIIACRTVVLVYVVVPLILIIFCFITIVGTTNRTIPSPAFMLLNPTSPLSIVIATAIIIHGTSNAAILYQPFVSGNMSLRAIVSIVIVLLMWLPFIVLVPLFSVTSVVLGCIIPTALSWKTESSSTRAKTIMHLGVMVCGVLLLCMSLYFNVVALVNVF